MTSLLPSQLLDYNFRVSRLAHGWRITNSLIQPEFVSCDSFDHAEYGDYESEADCEKQGESYVFAAAHFVGMIGRGSYLLIGISTVGALGVVSPHRVMPTLTP